jgi:hypothetical protein
LIGSVRRECTDHVIVFGESHLRRVASLYASYYNEARTHLSLGKDAPISRPIEQFGRIIAEPMLGGFRNGRFVRALVIHPDLGRLSATCRDGLVPYGRVP